MKAMDQAKRSQSAMKYSLNQSSGRHDRDSSLELLKIIAMIAIVCSHVVDVVAGVPEDAWRLG